MRGRRRERLRVESRVHDTNLRSVGEQNRCQVGPTILFECPAQIPRSSLRSFSLWARHSAETSEPCAWVRRNGCQVGPTILFGCPAKIPRSFLRSFSLWARDRKSVVKGKNVGRGGVRGVMEKAGKGVVGGSGRGCHV